MGRSDLERLVFDAERDAALRGLLRRCHSPQDLVLVARCLGYRITRLDLERAGAEHRQEQQPIRRKRWQKDPGVLHHNRPVAPMTPAPQS